MTGKPTNAVSPPGPEHPAMVAVRDALSERLRLEGLRSNLAGRRPEQEAARAAAEREADAAEADLLLAADGKAAAKRADAARAALREAEATLGRTDAALRALPAKLGEADEAIATAAPAMDELYAERVRVALAAYADELAAVAKQLAAVLLKGHAINAAARNLRDHLDGMHVPALRYGEAHFVRGHVAEIGGEMVRLNEAWQSDERALEIFSDLLPLRRLADQLGQHRDRIGRERDERRVADDAAARSRAFANGPLSSTGGPSPAPRNPVEWKPPAGAGPLRSYEVREPGTPVPVEASIGGKLLEQALPTECENRSWPQSPEAAARLAGHR